MSQNADRVIKITKEVTIYDIAKALNISPATVSRGLKDHPAIGKDTKRKILEAARKMRYQQNTFASNLRKKHTNTIGVIIPRLNSYFMATVIAGMEKIANKAGYNLIISQSQESAEKEIASVRTMFNSRVDGLLVSLAYDTTGLEHFNILFEKRIPLIFFDRVFDHPDCTKIVIDNYKAGYDATKHLIDEGCKRIVHIGGNFNCNVYSDRFKGYRQALAENGIGFDPSLIFINNLSDQAGKETAHHILKMKNLPDGIFTVNDTSAVACLRELKKAGVKVPEEIAVVGFNNDPISSVIEPNLTTIHYSGQEMGEIAASTLINALNKVPGANTDAHTLVLKHDLIIRDSSARNKRH